MSSGSVMIFSEIASKPQAFSRLCINSATPALDCNVEFTTLWLGSSNGAEFGSDNDALQSNVVRQLILPEED